MRIGVFFSAVFRHLQELDRFNQHLQASINTYKPCHRLSPASSKLYFFPESNSKNTLKKLWDHCDSNLRWVGRLFDRSAMLF